MNEMVTSVSKREQKLTDAAAAVTVFRNDDLRRSGVTTIPDALRLVPGANIGAVNAREFAVSVRGFNSVFANKLLVLLDGRAVYTPPYSGVHWDLQQTMLEDVDRIEAIRGPGAAIWGANALNGVINVVTRDARATQGTFVDAGGGDFHQTIAGVRHGGRIGEHTFYRVFASHRSYLDYPLANGQSANDAWRARHGGFRLDHYSGEDTQFTWQADITSMSAEDLSEGFNLNTLGRWTHRWSDRSSVEVQAYFDRTEREEPARAKPEIDTFDLSAQHTFGLGERHDVIWGLGYRLIGTELSAANPFIRVLDDSFHQQLFSAFVQDGFKLVPGKLTLTLGAKLEHNDFTGFEFQPSVRAAFKPTEAQTMWAAVSRAVRTPSAVEGRNLVAIPFRAPEPGPDGGLYLPTLFGAPTIVSEVLWASEVGYRIQITRRVNVDLAAYHNDYDKLITPGPVVSYESGAPFGTATVLWANVFHGTTYGAEALVTVAPMNNWRVTTAYSFSRQHIHGPADTGSNPPASPPRHQAALRSAYDFSPRASLDGQLRAVGSIPRVPAYMTADIRLSYRPHEWLELSLVGQNLFDRQHPEQAPVVLTSMAEVPRSVYGKVTLRF